MALRPERDPRRAAGGEMILPVAALAFTAYYFVTIWDSPWEAQVAAFLIGSILIGLIVLLAIRTGHELAAGRADLCIGDLAGPREILPRRLAMLALTVGYLVGIDWLGFTLTSFLFLMLGMLVLEDADRVLRRLPHFAAVAAVLSLAGWAVFIRAFDARFPQGPLEAALAAIFGG